MDLIDAAQRGALVALLTLVVQAGSASPWVEHQLSCAAQSPGIGISLGVAVLFWLFVRAVFEDGFRLRAWPPA